MFDAPTKRTAVPGRPRTGLRAPITAAVTLLLAAMLGVFALGSPAYASAWGDTVAITDSADPVPVGISYTYNVTGTAPTDCDSGHANCDVDTGLVLDFRFINSPATITAATASSGSCFIDASQASQYAVCQLGVVPHASAVSATFTILPNAVGTVTANTYNCNNDESACDAHASETTTITPAGFPFAGFFQPVANRPTINLMNAGRAVPIKFSLAGNQGLSIFPAGYPASQQVTCDTGAPIDTVEQTMTGGGSSLSYDPGSDTYNYVWKTDKAWAGTCRTFDLQLTDGTNHTATFKFH